MWARIANPRYRVQNGRDKHYTQDINEFSNEDYDANRAGYTNYDVYPNTVTKYISCFVVTPNGSLFVHDLLTPTNKNDKNRRVGYLVSDMIPSDPYSNSRKNDISPNVKPAILPWVYDSKVGDIPEKFQFNFNFIYNKNFNY